MSPRKILIIGAAFPLALSAGRWIADHPISLANTNDPHTPCPRSKGEKARNRRHRK